LTLKELSQLYHLSKEIEMDEQRLQELKARAESPFATRIDGMPKSCDNESKLERNVATLVDLEALIHAKQEQCICERNRLEQFIADITDSLTRQIFTLRFVEGLDWEDVAEGLNGRFSAGYVKNICYKYLKKCKKRQKVTKDVKRCHCPVL